MPAVFLALFYDKLTGRVISFCRIFQMRGMEAVKKDKVARKFWNADDTDRGNTGITPV